jgi:hypothetical protein
MYNLRPESIARTMLIPICHKVVLLIPHSSMTAVPLTLTISIPFFSPSTS